MVIIVSLLSEPQIFENIGAVAGLWDSQLLICNINCNINLSDMWFQQGGGTCHTERKTMEQLRSEFGEQSNNRF